MKPANILLLLQDAPESRFAAVHLLPRQQLNKTSRRAADESGCEQFGSVNAVTRACQELSGAAGSSQPPRYSALSGQEGVTQGIFTLG